MSSVHLNGSSIGVGMNPAHQKSVSSGSRRKKKHPGSPTLSKERRDKLHGILLGQARLWPDQVVADWFNYPCEVVSRSRRHYNLRVNNLQGKAHVEAMNDPMYRKWYEAKQRKLHPFVPQKSVDKSIRCRADLEALHDEMFLSGLVTTRKTRVCVVCGTRLPLMLDFWKNYDHGMESLSASETRLVCLICPIPPKNK